MANPHNPSQDKLRWIESAGCPFIIVNSLQAHGWRGVEGEDYEAACLVEDYLCRVDVGLRGSGIVVADEPLPATFLPELSCVLQWSYAESDQILIDGAKKSFADIEDWEPGPIIDATGELVMFDASIPGGSLAQDDILSISLRPGTYQFSTADFEVDEETAGRLHSIRALRSSDPAAV
ncbi:MAG: Imm21 family immunity protein [Streptomyces sp.]|uniref:Imm21 family immunity protein n=1 Tax=Streptomyces sp. TaxID=1931 RepID=UPI003D6A1F15